MPKIFKQDMFVNEQGVRLVQLTEVNPPEGAASEINYGASAMMPFQLSTGERIQHLVEFNIPATSLGDAFANFNAALQPAYARAAQELSQQLAARHQAIVGVDGNPIVQSKNAS